MKKIKETVFELVEIAKACPDNLQQTCFQALLNHFLQGIKPLEVQPDKEVITEQQHKDKPGQAGTEAKKPEVTQDNFKDTDLHLKAKKFLQKESLTIAHLNNLFYKENGGIRPLYDDLKTTRMAESQIRIALLQSLVHAITTGEFETQVESVRTECVKRKCYESSNFTAAFKNNRSLFDFNKFDKMTKSVRLSEAGRKELAGLIKELQ